MYDACGTAGSEPLQPLGRLDGVADPSEKDRTNFRGPALATNCDVRPP